MAASPHGIGTNPTRNETNAPRAGYKAAHIDHATTDCRELQPAATAQAGAQCQTDTAVAIGASSLTNAKGDQPWSVPEWGQTAVSPLLETDGRKLPFFS